MAAQLPNNILTPGGIKTVEALPVLLVDQSGNYVAAGGGGGGGGAVTIADGADVAEGATTATFYTDTTGAAAGSVVAITKGLFVLEAARLGSLTETAPATDTASSGLNGRLQRIAQRLTSLIGLLPSALGAQAAAGSLSVVQATSSPFAVTATQLPSALGAQAAAGSLSIVAATGTTFATTATQLPSSVGAKTGALSLSVVPNTDTAFSVTATQLPSSLGAKTSALSLSTAPATDAVFPPGGTAAPAGNSTSTQITASTSSTTLLAANTARRGRVSVYYANAGALMSIHEGTGAATASNFVCQLGQNGLYLYETPDNFTGALSAIWSAASGTAQVTERTA